MLLHWIYQKSCLKKHKVKTKTQVLKYVKVIRGRKMLVEKYINGLNQRSSIEFKNISGDIIPWLEQVAAENNCIVEKKEWKSKYNSYVIYDYEPFCSDGFEINMTISSHDVNYLYFVKFLYDNKLETIEYLNSCIDE